MCITCGEHVYYTPRITHVYATHVHVLYLYVYTFNTCVGLHLRGGGTPILGHGRQVPW